MSSTETEPQQVGQWEYLIVPLADARKVKKRSADVKPDHLNVLGSQGREAAGLSLRNGDLLAWPVVLLKPPVH